MQPFRSGLQIRLQPMLRALLPALILELLRSLYAPHARQGQSAALLVSAATTFGYSLWEIEIFDS